MSFKDLQRVKINDYASNQPMSHEGESDSEHSMRKKLNFNQSAKHWSVQKQVSLQCIEEEKE